MTVRTEPAVRPRALPTPETAPWGALPIILLGAFVSMSSFFMVNVALAAIARDLDASNAMLELITAAYSLSYAATLVTGGRLGDRFGRRRLFMVGTIGFALASAACAAAVDGWTLAVARLVQGLGAGLLVPQVLGTIQAAFPGPARQRALGWFGATGGLGCVAGQMLGGAAVSLDAGSGWRGAFLVYVPIGLATALAARRWVPETRGRATPTDVTGALLLALILALVLVPLTLGAGAGWPLWCWIGLALAPVAVVAFLSHQRGLERRGGSPLLPPSLLRLKAFRNGLVVAALFFAGVGGFFLTTGFSLQRGLGFAPMTTALVLAPYAIGFLIVSLVVSRLVARFGGWVIVAGSVLLALGMAGVALQAAAGYAGLTPIELAPTFVAVGLGQGLVMVPLFGIVLAQIPVERAGFAAGVLSTAQQGSLAVGVALFGTLLFAYAGGGVGSSGWRTATVVVAAAQAALALVTAAVSYVGVVRRA